MSLPVVVMATRSSDAFDVLRPSAVRIAEVITTRGLLQSLEMNPALVVVDLGDLVVTNGITLTMAEQALSTARSRGVPVLDAESVASRMFDIGRLASARTPAGVRYVMPRIVMVSSFAGGIGKTTLSIALARAFAESTGLQSAVLEAGVGASVMSEKLGIKDVPSLYSIVQVGSAPLVWHGVSLLPLSSQEAQALGADAFASVLDDLREKHALIVVDASPLSPLWDALLNIADDILIPLTPRADTHRQAETLFADIAPQGRHAKFVLNMVSGLSDRVSYSGDVLATVGLHVSRAQSFEPALAKNLMAALYPGLAQRDSVFNFLRK